MRWSEARLKEFNEQFERESQLQTAINRYCREHGYPFLSFRQSRKAQRFLTAGWPDMTVCLPGGRTVYLELKIGRGRLSHEQQQTHKELKYLGHEVYEVRSFKQFYEIIRKREDKKIKEK